MPYAASITDNYGPCPPLEELALVVSSTSATAYVEIYGSDGRTLVVPTQITVTSTAQSIYTILATAGVTWDEGFHGMVLISCATATIYANYGARLAKVAKGDGTFSYTASVSKAPTANSRSVPAGDYSAGGWYIFGRVATC